MKYEVPLEIYHWGGSIKCVSSDSTIMFFEIWESTACCGLWQRDTIETNDLKVIMREKNHEYFDVKKGGNINFAANFLHHTPQGLPQYPFQFPGEYLRANVQ